jgi:hypothetical protein
MAIKEPWHIRYVAGDNIPQAVLDYETSLLPPATPAPQPVPPQPEPTPGDDDMKLVVVGSTDTTDPRRWWWNGLAMRHITTPAEYDETRLLFPINPSYTLSNPFTMPVDRILSYPGA